MVVILRCLWSSIHPPPFDYLEWGLLQWCNPLGYSSSDALVYFDLNEVVAREMPMPPHLGHCQDLKRYFGESNEHLFLVDYYQDYIYT